jgi:hypothetical protein
MTAIKTMTIKPNRASVSYINGAEEEASALSRRSSLAFKVLLAVFARTPPDKSAAKTPLIPLFLTLTRTKKYKYVLIPTQKRKKQ